MSTHNICFRGEIRKILCGYPLLSVAMVQADRIFTIYTSSKIHPLHDMAQITEKMHLL